MANVKKSSKTTKSQGKGFTVKQLLDFAKSVNKKAESDRGYKRIIDVASEKWEGCCGYELK